jgi:elongation factor P--(R)-beta-lysine ligase
MQPHWQPTAAIETLIARATILRKIRDFFKAQGVLEVETPLLAHATASDPYIQSFSTFLVEPGNHNPKKLYLQTSPEFAMKRLLAAGIGPIYQICKAFRNEESGRLHNPEFTMLEWYRPGFNHHQLMDEMDQLLKHILNTPEAERLSYQALFLTHLQLDPHQASLAELQRCATQHNLHTKEPILEGDTWLQLLMSHVIEPQLGRHAPLFVYDFPASQAALAKIRRENVPVAERFEVYIKGLEIANGYHELGDPIEQQYRFEQDLVKRKALQQPTVPIDTHLIAALKHGFPNCAGVALGVDRLIMLATQQTHIANVIAFPIERA